MKNYLFLFCSVVLFSSCKKEEEKPLSPAIEYVSISETSVTAFNNQLEIVFSYEDFQGDLGTEDADDYSLRVKDDRLGEFDWYHLPPMTPDLEELHIKGNYRLVLEPLFLMGSGGQETTKFTIQIQDRAGNWSNQIVTPDITVLPQ